MKKRYLITYKDKDLTLQKINTLFGTNNSIKEFSADTIINESSNYHFRNLGISSHMLSEKDVQVLKTNPKIASIEEDTGTTFSANTSDTKPKLRAALSDSYSWNMQLINAPKAWAKGYTGTGVNVAILSTGIANHPELNIKGGISTIPNWSSYMDDQGHGTHLAGIIAGLGKSSKSIRGVAPDASLYAVKVLEKTSVGGAEGKMTWIIAGMDWCIGNGIDVMCMGVSSQINPSEAYSVGVKQCQQADIMVVCASGDSFGYGGFSYVNAPANSGILDTPLASPMAVGAIDNTSQVSAFSSRGGKSEIHWNYISVVAPGVDIYSTFLNNEFRIMSGTGTACAHVAGLVALLKQKNKEMQQRNGKLNPLVIKSLICSTAKGLGQAPLPNTPYGYGLIDCDKVTN
ncbi:S8 family serine peptidase [Fluviicola sp.]|uniref:S8 family peptidase n=1 Tax=Fluviicola sp. TaxID=1917219 RepID=UPI0031DA26AA